METIRDEDGERSSGPRRDGSNVPALMLEIGIWNSNVPPTQRARNCTDQRRFAICLIFFRKVKYALHMPRDRIRITGRLQSIWISMLMIVTGILTRNLSRCDNRNCIWNSSWRLEALFLLTIAYNPNVRFFMMTANTVESLYLRVRRAWSNELFFRRNVCTLQEKILLSILCKRKRAKTRRRRYVTSM